MPIYRFKYLLSCTIDRRKKFDLSYSDMKVCDKKHFFFVHIPKAAGKSMRYSLFGRENGACHARAIDLKRKYRNKWESYFKFGFVRNPWDRLLSAYNYLRNGGNGSEEDVGFMERQLRKNGIDCFEKFVHEWLTKDRAYSFIHLVPQTEFVLHRGRLQVDFIGKFENVDSDFKKVVQSIGIDCEPLQHLNASRKLFNTYREKYDDIMKTIVNDIYSEDVQFFQYHF